MSMNPFLHPRNPYRTPPDFNALAKEEPEFRKVAKTELSGKVSVNFEDRQAVRVLTTVLLKRDFGLEVGKPLLYGHAQHPYSAVPCPLCRCSSLP